MMTETPAPASDGERVATIELSPRRQMRVSRRHLRGEWRIWLWEWERSGDDRDWRPAKDARGHERFYVVPRVAWSALAAVLARVAAEHEDPSIVDAMAALERMNERRARNAGCAAEVRIGTGNSGEA
jgi:hypothetical protein